MSDIHEANAIIVSTHSQGSIVSTHLLNNLIQDNYITTTTSRKHDSTTNLEQAPKFFHPRLKCLNRSQGERARYNRCVVWRSVGSILGH